MQTWCYHCASVRSMQAIRLQRVGDEAIWVGACAGCQNPTWRAQTRAAVSADGPPRVSA